MSAEWYLFFTHIDDNNDLTGHKMIEKIMVVSGAEALE
jgi:hypothetical protein